MARFILALFIIVSLALTPLPAAAQDGGNAPTPTDIYDRGVRRNATGALVGNVYTVAAGDYLSAIAARFGVTLSTLQSTNRITNANVLVVGRRLTIPGLGSPAAPQPTPNGDKLACAITLYRSVAYYDAPNGTEGGIFSAGTHLVAAQRSKGWYAVRLVGANSVDLVWINPPPGVALYMGACLRLPAS
ncbi:MAG TPA: LysM domain-containing protein [Aggregatilineales bacterium]|nr:LysM peptidoglycan-binding domain-containing protein [Anaerolineales bacterium]HRE47517.1 LysM domain-containing protein [Aggregatilineales bacterium]